MADKKSPEMAVRFRPPEPIKKKKMKTELEKIEKIGNIHIQKDRYEPDGIQVTIRGRLGQGWGGY